MKKQAFTLVELIVVITILAILGTIGFISLQGFSSNSRDSKRISELSEIRNGLQIYQARNGLLPTPSEQTVTIGSGSTTLIIQGYAGDSVLNYIKMSGNPKDPLNNSYYTYSVNSSKTKFQLLSLLENNENSTAYNNLNIISKTHASYLNRHIYILGQNVGIFLDENNNPIHELSGTGIDLSTLTPSYKVLFADSVNNTTLLNGEDLYNEIVIKTQNTGTTQTNNITTPEPIYSCASQPNYTNAIFITGNPTSENQIWTNSSDIEIPCRYECTGWYTGNECEIEPFLTFVETAEGSGIFRTPDEKIIKITPDSPGSSLSYTIMTYNPAKITSQSSYSAGVNSFNINGVDPGIQWGCRISGNAVGSTSLDGKVNTDMIINFHNGLTNYYGNPTQCAGTNNGDVASLFCSNLIVSVNGVTYDDWYLPSGYSNALTRELQILFNNKGAIGGFDESGVNYRSSYEISSTAAYRLRFSTISWGTSTKDLSTNKVRCIRKED